MANEIRIGLGVTGEQVAKQKLQVVEKQAEKTGDAIEDMGSQATVAGKATDKVGDDFKGAADEAGHLQREVDELTASYKKLIEQFDATGDESLKKDIGKERRKLNTSKRLLKDLLPDADVAEAGTAVGKGLVESIGGAVKAGGPYVTAGLAALAVTAAPGISAIIAGAVLGGVGIGGVVGGVALAAQDPDVKSAAEEVAAIFGGQFTAAAEGFVEPVMRSLGKAANVDWANKLTKSFDELATHVEPLADGLLGMVDNILPGFQDALEAAGPTLDMLAKELPDLGDSLGNFFGSLSDNPEAAAIALKGLLETAEDLIEISGDVISWLTDTYEAAYILGHAIGLLDPEVVGKKFGQADREVKQFANTAKYAAVEVEDLEKAISKLLAEEFGLEAAQDAVAESVVRLKEQVREQREEHEKGAGSLIGNTQAARDNREMMRSLTDQYSQLIIETAAAGGDTSRLRKQFVDNAVAAGFARKEAERYGAALDFPQNIRTTLWVDVRVNKSLNKILDGVNSVLDGARASGGSVSPNSTYLVGENGPELLRMGASGGYVHNAGQTAAMMSGASGGSVAGAGAMQVAVTVVGGDALTRAVAESLRFEIRTTANGDPTEYFS